MDFKKRIGRLTKRHEALNQAIALMGYERTRKAAEYDKRFANIETPLKQLLASVTSHEKRLSRIEGA